MCSMLSSEGKYGPHQRSREDWWRARELLMTGPAIAETGGADFFPHRDAGAATRGKFLGNEIEGGEILAAEALLEKRE